MPRYEYKLVPAPEKATKHKGLKGAANFAATLRGHPERAGAEGWHYLRADTLPQEERSGLTSKTTTYRNLLIFQRGIAEGRRLRPRRSRPKRSREEDGKPRHLFRRSRGNRRKRRQPKA